MRVFDGSRDNSCDLLVLVYKTFVSLNRKSLLLIPGPLPYLHKQVWLFSAFFSSSDIGPYYRHYHFLSYAPRLTFM